MTDYRRSGYVSANEGESWIAQWSKKVYPKVVCLFGGEPLMNPDIYKWIELLRKYWPESTIKLNTNGLLFDKKPDIFNKLIAVQPSELQISLHFRNSKIRKEIINDTIAHLKDLNLIFKPVKTRSPQEQKLFVYKNFNLILAEFGDFVKPYKGYAKSMMPWNSNDIDASHRMCGSPRNPILYKNKIYKCGPISNLKDTLELFNLTHEPLWDKYLAYTGFTVTDDIKELLENFGKPEWICSMCSSTNQALVNHYKENSVTFKNKRSKC